MIETTNFYLNFNELFFGILFILFGVSLILKSIFNINIPLLKVFFGIVLIYWGITLLIPESKFQLFKRTYKHEITKKSYDK